MSIYTPSASSPLWIEVNPNDRVSHLSNMNDWDGNADDVKTLCGIPCTHWSDDSHFADCPKCIELALRDYPIPADAQSAA